MKKTILTALFFATLTIIVFLIIISQRGLLQIESLQDELDTLNEHNAELRRENKILKKEIMLLKNSSDYIAELARRELGLVKEGEMVYHFEKEK